MLDGRHDQPTCNPTLDAENLFSLTSDAQERGRRRHRPSEVASSHPSRVPRDWHQLTHETGDGLDATLCS